MDTAGCQGNHENVNAQFSTDKEFRFPSETELREEDGLIIYAEPA